MEDNQYITCERRTDSENSSQDVYENRNNVENVERIPIDCFLNVEELSQEMKRKVRSPATHRKLSGRASKYALIQYLSNVAKNRSAIESFDFTFVEYLLDNGADINDSDIIGQSSFHIVAKFWSIDVARFLLDHDADINAQDFLGRSPLHEAAGLDYADMVEFLLQNGADLDSETSDQNQKPIHFAAKNNSCQSLTTLLAYGADINSLDNKKRTPLQVAAEMNRSKIAELLIQEGASAAIYDDDGNSALTLLIERIPDVALVALNQLYNVDDLKRLERFSLNKLEAPRIEDGTVNAARAPLEVAVQNRRFAIVMHPVVQRLIDVKWENYGKRGAIYDLILNIIYVILWSIISIVLSYSSQDMYLPIASKGWRLAIVIAIIIITAGEITKQISDMFRVRRQQKEWIKLRANSLEENLSCNPRCPDEWTFLSNEVKSVRNHCYLSTEESGIYIDRLALFLVIAAIITHVIFLNHDNMAAYKVHRGVLIALLLFLWIRMAKFARPFRSTGPIVVIFAHILKDIIKSAFLFAILFIPYACAFWITYGSYSPSPVKGYSNFFDLLYNLLCMVVGIDFPFNDLLLADPFMARILCSSFIISATIVVVNVLIALLSDTFTRLYSNAVANAIMQRAQCILVIERSLGKKRKQEYYEYMGKHCSPYEVVMDHERASKREKTSYKNKIAEELKQVNIAIRSLYGKSSSIQPENRKNEEQNSIDNLMRQVLKQSTENTAKINKMYSRMIERTELEETVVPPAGQHDLLLSRKFSVFSTVSENVAIYGCFDVQTTVQSNMLEENPGMSDIRTLERSGIIQTAAEEIPARIGNQRKSVVRSGEHPRIRVIGEENDGFDDCEIFSSRPPCSNWDNDEDTGQTRNSNLISHHRSSTVAFAYPLFSANSRTSRTLCLDCRTESSTGSLSL